MPIAHRQAAVDVPLVDLDISLVDLEVLLVELGDPAEQKSSSVRKSPLHPAQLGRVEWVVVPPGARLTPTPCLPHPTPYSFLSPTLYSLHPTPS